MGDTAGHPGPAAPGEQPYFPQDRPDRPHQWRGGRDPHARLDHGVPLPELRDPRIPAGHRAGVLHHPLHRYQYFTAHGAQGLHRPSERRAGRPPQAAGPHRKRPPVPRKHHARPPPDRRICGRPAHRRREHRAAAAAE